MTAPLAADSSKVLAVARAELGVHEDPANSNRTKFSEWYGLIGPWCAMFVSWVFAHAGAPLPPISTSRGFAYCPAGVAWARKAGRWADPGHRPDPGDIVFFDFIGRPSHTGIVQGVLADGRIHTIEGNTNGAGSRTGGMVMEHNRAPHGGGLIGYLVVDDVAAPAVTPPAPHNADRPVILLGSKGPAVWLAQTVLRDKAHQRNVVGPRKGFELTVDGDFGANTDRAVRNLQAVFGLKPDGIVGAKTWDALAAINR